MKLSGVACVVGLVLLPSLAMARSDARTCRDAEAPSAKAAEACLNLLAAQDLSLAEQIELHRLRAGHLERGYDYTLALIHVNRVLVLAPDDLEAWLMKARLLDLLGNHATALEMIHAAQAEHPESFLPLKAEFDALERGEDKTAALDFAEAVILRFPKSPEAYAMRGDASIGLRNLRHAMDDYHVAFLYGDHSVTTIKRFFAACQWSLGPCPHLYPNARISEPDLACDQARDWVLARMRERPDLKYEKRDPSFFASRSQMQGTLDRMEGAMMAGGSDAGVYAASAYVAASISLMNKGDKASAVRVIVHERLLRCYYDNDPMALFIVDRAQSKAVFSEQKVSFADVWHQDVRTNFLDYAYQILNGDPG